MRGTRETRFQLGIVNSGLQYETLAYKKLHLVYRELWLNREDFFPCCNLIYVVKFYHICGYRFCSTGSMKRNDLLFMGVIMLPEPASQFVIFCCINNHAEQINNICAWRHGLCDFCIPMCTVLRIQIHWIHWIRILNQYFKWIRTGSKVLMTKNKNKNTDGYLFYYCLFWLKIAIYLSQGLYKGPPSHSRSLEP